jgi:hypothetical protein
MVLGRKGVRSSNVIVLGPYVDVFGSIAEGFCYKPI